MSAGYTVAECELMYLIAVSVVFLMWNWRALKKKDSGGINLVFPFALCSFSYCGRLILESGFQWQFVAATLAFLLIVWVVQETAFAHPEKYQGFWDYRW